MFDYLEQLLLIFRCNKDVVECLEKINYLSAMQPKYIQMKWYHIKKLENGLGHPGSPWRVGEELGAEVRGVELKAAEASGAERLGWPGLAGRAETSVERRWTCAFDTLEAFMIMDGEDIPDFSSLKEETAY